MTFGSFLLRKVCGFFLPKEIAELGGSAALSRKIRLFDPRKISDKNDVFALSVVKNGPNRS